MVNRHLGTERLRSMKKQLGNEVTRLETKLVKGLQGDKSIILGVLVSTIAKIMCVSSGQKPAYQLYVISQSLGPHQEQIEKSQEDTALRRKSPLGGSVRLGSV